MNEISCRITNSFLHYVKNTKPALVTPLLKDFPHDESYLMNTDNWISWDNERLLEERLTRLFNDEMIMFKIGKSVLNNKSLGIVNLLFKLFMTPERLIRYTPKIARYFTKDLVHIRVLETSHDSATIELKIRGKQTRGACLYNQGMFSICTELFGLEAAEISELQCVVPVNNVGGVNGKLYSIDSNKRVTESGPLGENGKVIGLASEQGEFQVNKTIFGAESCVYRIKWNSKSLSHSTKTDGKEKVMKEALQHLEKSHEKLETAYEKLWHSEARYRSLMENASDMICLLNSDGMITSINRKGIELSGYASKEIIGNHFLDFVADEYKRPALLKFRKAFDYSSSPFELVMKTKGSDYRILSANSNPVKEAGHAVGLMVIARDITKDREITARLLEAERFAAKGIVAAEIAHEINNSLANIESSLFITRNIHTDKAYSQDIYTNVFDEIERMSGIVKGILDVYRSDHAAIQPINLNTEISKVITMTRRRLHGKDVSVAFSLAPELPFIPCSSGHIQQILLNLIKNAEEAMDSSNNKLIKISTESNDTYVHMKVEDSGCGIPASSEEKVFSSLFTSKAYGSGFGLSICRQLANKYNGNVAIASREGKGTAVTVSFPVKGHA